LGADEELIHPPAETESPPGPEQPWEARSTEPQVVLPQVQQLAYGIADQLLRHHGCPSDGHIEQEEEARAASGQRIVSLREATQQT
ncbi:unnamed protein product, partial [Penicillium egyptiacum]